MTVGLSLQDRPRNGQPSKLPSLFGSMVLLSLAAFGVTVALWITTPVGRQHWLFVRDSADRPGAPAAQHNWDITFSRGFEVSHEFKDWNRWHYRQVTVPYAAIALLFAILPIMWCLRYLIATRRVLTGHCVACGYDLRGTPHRCPECGKQVTI